MLACGKGLGLVYHLYDTFYSLLQIDSENSGVDEEREGRLFPEPNSDTRIQCHDMTNEFLIYGTDVSMGINEFTLQNGNID